MTASRPADAPRSLASATPFDSMKPSVHRIFNLWIAIAPFLGFLVAVGLLWNSIISAVDLACLAVMYLVTGLGITMGYHRLLTHRSFKTHRWIRDALAVMGSMAGQGPPIIWAADHRKHHTFADEDGDPHSPHLVEGTGLRGAVKGLWHGHMGWLFRMYPASDPMRYSRDLVADRHLRAISALFVPLVALGFLIPFVAGLSITGSLAGGLTAMVWGGFVRLFFGYHVVFSINSICHFFGRRRFATDDESKNVGWLSVPSLGESWHHNHHAFPRSARHGLRWWEVDITGWLIHAMERVGLAWDVVRATPEAQAAKQIPPAEGATVSR